jgi:hypothetical protein
MCNRANVHVSDVGSSLARSPPDLGPGRSFKFGYVRTALLGPASDQVTPSPSRTTTLKYLSPVLITELQSNTVTLLTKGNPRPGPQGAASLSQPDTYRAPEVPALTRLTLAALRL